MKNQNKVAAQAIQLTPEQKAVLDIVNKKKCNARQLDMVLRYCCPLEAEQMAQDIFTCISILLSSAEDLDGEEIGSLYKCFEFARLLSELREM